MLGFRLRGRCFTAQPHLTPHPPGPSSRRGGRGYFTDRTASVAPTGQYWFVQCNKWAVLYSSTVTIQYPIHIQYNSNNTQSTSASARAAFCHHELYSIKISLTVRAFEPDHLQKHHSKRRLAKIGFCTKCLLDHRTMCSYSWIFVLNV